MRGEPLPPIHSSNTCGRSSLFLRDVLQQAGHCAEWTNGVPRLGEDLPDIGSYGFFAGRRWESHAWVVSDGFIVDITADQFGAEPIIVTPINDTRYSPGTGDTAWPDAAKARVSAVAEIWPEWLARRDGVKLRD